MKPVMTLNKIPANNATNDYGFETIHFYAFNFDGEGSALAICDESTEFEIFGGIDLNLILFGNVEKGVRWYEPALTVEDSAEMSSPDLQSRCLELLDESIRRGLLTVIVTPERQAEYTADKAVTQCEDVISANRNGLGIDLWISKNN